MLRTVSQQARSDHGVPLPLRVTRVKVADEVVAGELPAGTAVIDAVGGGAGVDPALSPPGTTLIRCTAGAAGLLIPQEVGARATGTPAGV